MLLEPKTTRSVRIDRLTCSYVRPGTELDTFFEFFREASIKLVGGEYGVLFLYLIHVPFLSE